jgi:hypothetical protein
VDAHGEYVRATCPVRLLPPSRGCRCATLHLPARIFNAAYRMFDFLSPSEYCCVISPHDTGNPRASAFLFALY